MPALRAAHRWVPVPLLAGALGACGPATGPGARGPTASTCWPIAALRLESREMGGAWEAVLSLDEDGRVRRARSGTFGLLADDRFEMTVGGTLTCLPDRFVAQNGQKTALHHAVDGALVEGSHRVHVGPDGTVTFQKGGPGSGKVRVVGKLDEGTRRTAALLAFAHWM